MYSHWTYITAAIIGTVSVARTLRLVIYDDYPPMMWLRKKLLRYTPLDWVKLWECQFCLAPYFAAVMLAWAYWSDLHWTWWLVNGWWAASYVSAIVVSFDQPDG